MKWSKITRSGQLRVDLSRRDKIKQNLNTSFFSEFHHVGNTWEAVSTIQTLQNSWWENWYIYTHLRHRRLKVSILRTLTVKPKTIFFINTKICLFAGKANKKAKSIIVHCAVNEECTNNRIFNKINNYGPLSKPSILPATSSAHKELTHQHCVTDE